MNRDGGLSRDVGGAEREFASALLRVPERISDARLLVASDQISDQHVRSVLSLIYAEDDAGRRLTPQGAADLLDKLNLHTPDGGWSSFMAVLECETISAAYLPFHARVITEAYRMRKATELMRTSAIELDEARAGTGDGDEVIDRHMAALETVEERDGDVQESVDAIDAGAELVEAIARGEKYSGVATGLLDLDNALLGMRPGEMYVIGARPAQGKTTLALQIALNAATVGVRTVFFSLEVPTQELGERLVANLSGVNGSDIRKREFGVTRLAGLRDAAQKIPKALHLKADSATTIQKLRGVLRRYKRRNGLGLCVIDYLQLLHAPGAENRVREVSIISAALKDLAKELACPMLVCCQLNRAAEGEEPRISHLRESGSIENDSDVVMLLAADKEAKTIDCMIAKNRHGPACKVTFYWDRELFKVRDFGVIRSEEIHFDKPQTWED